MIFPKTVNGCNFKKPEFCSENLEKVLAHKHTVLNMEKRNYNMSKYMYCVQIFLFSESQETCDLMQTKRTGESLYETM